jgi:type I restriction enzyme, S subunit
MNHWPHVKLQEIVSFKTGKLDSNAAEADGKYPFFTCSPETLRINSYAFDTTAILLAGNNATGVFPVKYYSGKFNCYQRTYVIENIAPQAANLSYLYFAIQLQLKFLQSMSIGAATKFLTMRILNNLKIPLPPLSIQQKIAGILAVYDDLIENNLKRIKLLEEMAQITYEEWFVRLRFPGYESTSINPESGLPEGWEIKKVGSLLGKAPKSAKIKSSEIKNSGSIPVVDQSKDFVAGYTDDPESLINANHPVIIFGDHTRVLKFINFPFARGADGTQVIISNDKRMPQHLFYHALLNLDLSNYHYARHYKFLKELEVIVPDLNVASEYEQNTKGQFEAVKSLRQQNHYLREARDILLPRLMTGVIDVESYDPAQLLREAA